VTSLPFKYIHDSRDVMFLQSATRCLQEMFGKCREGSVLRGNALQSLAPALRAWPCGLVGVYELFKRRRAVGVQQQSALHE
jgi:hypothetical protein